MKEEDPFRFLTDKEFLALPPKERALYLSRAAQEIEQRQRVLREQLAMLKRSEDKT